MWETPTLETLQEVYSPEVLNLCSINERFEKEDTEVQKTRVDYANIFQTLTLKRDEAGRSEAGRNFSIAITELRTLVFEQLKECIQNRD